MYFYAFFLVFRKISSVFHKKKFGRIDSRYYYSFSLRVCNELNEVTSYPAVLGNELCSLTFQYLIITNVWIHILCVFYVSNIAVLYPF